MMEFLQSKVSELVECPICSEVLQNAKALPCLHTFCLKCLKDYWKDKVAGQRVNCPVCREPFNIRRCGLEGLPNNFMMQNLIEIGNVTSDGSGGIPCKQHPEKLLETYCLNCETTICRRCHAANHRQHNCEEVSVVAEEFAKSLEEATSPVLLRIDEFQAALEQQETDGWHFRVAADGVDIAAKHNCEKIKNIVDGEAGEVLNELREIKSEEQKEKRSRIAALELAVADMQSFVRSSQELRTKGSPCDVICAAKDLRVRASQLLETYVISNGQIAPVVTFVPMNIDELTRVGQNLVGRIHRLIGPGKSLTFLGT